MQIIEYDAKYKKDFIQFNTDWIVEHFGALEAEDEQTFDTIEEEIRRGAMIYFAIEQQTVLATCMAKQMEENTWELCKLASNQHVAHKGAGSAVFEAAMKYAIRQGAKRLFLISNRKLKPALHIYEKYGFREIEMDHYEYARGDIAFEYIVPSPTKADILSRLAPCGLHCGRCFAYRGGEIGALSMKLKKALGNFAPYAERFSEQLSPVFQKYPDVYEMLSYFASADCAGCRKEECKFYKNCKVRKCAAKKHLQFCYQCDQFPCKDTGLDENLYQRHVAINKQIKEIGMEAYYDKIKDVPRY